MELWQIIFIYVFAWWVSLFLTLPFGVKTPDAPEPGHDAGAPARPYMGRKLIATTLLAAIWTALACLIITSGWIKVK